MCGIVGILSNKPVEQQTILLAMRDTMRHRGPDSAGVWWAPDGRVGLAHRRLAIVDLSPSGNQPMLHPSGDACIAFNGEIYNFPELREVLREKGHVFHSACDTEVLLTAYLEWGEECLSRLNGAFAFAIYDCRSRRVFAARDRAGEKPLFYAHLPGRFVFASELKALMADPGFPRELDIESFDQYLAYGYVSSEKCILRGVHKLPQGHAMVYDLDKDDLRVWPYWRLPEYDVSSTGKPEAAFADELHALLADSVQRQLVADVPVGVLLSGGMDSSVITAMAARVASRRIKTFTVTFPGAGQFNEAPFAKMVADYLGTDHTEIPADAVSARVLPELARQYDEPIADHSIIPTALLAHLMKQHVTVALGGDGADELFGGYAHYRWLLKLERLRRTLPPVARKAVGFAAERLLPIGYRGRNHLIGFAGDTARGLSSVNLFFDQYHRARLLHPLLAGKLSCAITPEQTRAALREPSATVLQNALRADFQTTLVDGYLVKVDRAGMLSSLEVRLPFLDYRIIEFVFGRLPDAQKADSNAGKLVLRRLARQLLPPAFDFDRKQGLTLPLESWLTGSWGDYMKEVLAEADPAIFDRNVIAGLFKGQARGLHNAERLFALTMFELWRREYRVGVGRSDDNPWIYQHVTFPNSKAP